MRNYVSVFCLALLILSFAACDITDQPTVKAKIARSIMANVAETLNHRFQLRYIGFKEAADVNYYKEIGLNFQLLGLLSKDEGRKIILDCTDELLSELNSSLAMRPYLQPYPFTLDNIEIAIYVRNADGYDVYYPNISVFSLRRRVLEFKTELPEMKNKYGYSTREKETWEDALEIVRSQKP